MSVLRAPPMLPMQWSGAYISYWSPMRDDDEITSGYCWFDYARNICRIDGLFNPWSEKEHGHRLWMSELGDVSRGQSRKQQVTYARETVLSGNRLRATAWPAQVAKFDSLYLPQSILVDGQARYHGQQEVLGQIADVWELAHPAGAPSWFYLEARGNRLLRMITGRDPLHQSVRDFPNVCLGGIAEHVFMPPQG